MTGRVLADAYDVVLLDLDGVVYIGGHAVPHAVEALREVRGRGVRLGFITNNAARTPEQIAAHLTELDVAAEPDDVVTSAQAVATMIADRHPHGTRVAVLGADGLRDALRERGLEPVGVADEADALVSGYGPEVAWREVMRAASRIAQGLPWFAANTDRTIPTPYGEAPGHGAQVDLLTRFSGIVPPVAGKPEIPLFDEARRRLAGDRVLMVGDRLDTDILGAHRAGIDSLLVMTGVTGRDELGAAPAGERPTYVADDLRGLLQPGSPFVAE
ncbi:MAG TPA: HAD-IIA family hydrolase [Nocardioides sp.]|nr:HAD-IIA family hydrolase [Nocardioides sp.]